MFYDKITISFGSLTNYCPRKKQNVIRFDLIEQRSYIMYESIQTQLT